MESAQGQVQQMKYTATFPLLLNVAEQPTYFMALKDAAGLVKMYAMVNVSQYQIVATGVTVAECETNYRQMLLNASLIQPEDSALPEDQLALTDARTGTITDIRSAVMDGNTRYFLCIGGEWYTGQAVDTPQLILLNVGDVVTVRCYAAAGGIAQPIYSIEYSGPQTEPVSGDDLPQAPENAA